MDDIIENIDFGTQKLAYSGKEIDKLTTQDGCALTMATNKAYSLDDESETEDEGFSDHPIHLNRQTKEERMKREFISLTLNSNRDPIKPGADHKFNRLFDDQDEIEEIYDSFLNPDRIHRRYEKLGKYDDLLKNDTNNFQEISSKGVYKRTLVPGVGSLMTETSMIIYNCALWTEKSKDPFDSTWLRRNTIITDLSTDYILPGLHELLLTMKLNEWCEALLLPEAAFGQLGVMPRIPPNATIFCLVEVVKIVPKDKISIMTSNLDGAGATFDDFYMAADVARKRGNSFYEAKQYRTALQRYKSGIRILEALTYKDEDQEKRANELLLKLYNNSARAANASGIPRMALAFCKQALMINDMEPKAYWNKIMAWKKKGHLDRALGIARRAIQLFPEPKTLKSFQREADQLKKDIQEEERQSDDLHRLMGRALLT